MTEDYGLWGHMWRELLGVYIGNGFWMGLLATLLTGLLLLVLWGVFYDTKRTDGVRYAILVLFVPLAIVVVVWFQIANNSYTQGNMEAEALVKLEEMTGVTGLEFTYDEISNYVVDTGEDKYLVTFTGGNVEYQKLGELIKVELRTGK